MHDLEAAILWLTAPELTFQSGCWRSCCGSPHQPLHIIGRMASPCFATMMRFFSQSETSGTLTMTMPKLCFVFDLDDTLYLERDFVCSGFEHVGIYAEKELGIPNFAERAWSLFVAGHR